MEVYVTIPKKIIEYLEQKSTKIKKRSKEKKCFTILFKKVF